MSSVFNWKSQRNLARNRSEGTPVLLTRADAYVSSDKEKFAELRNLSPKVIALQGGAATEGSYDAPSLNVAAAVASTALWTNVNSVYLGSSVTEALHPIIVTALKELFASLTVGMPIKSVSKLGDARKDLAVSLSQWLRTELTGAAKNTSADKMTPNELCYFLDSGGYRARALSKLLANIGKSTPSSILDVGGGIGLISYLVAMNSKQATKKVVVVDPTPRYEEPTNWLWQTVDDEIDHQFHMTSAENFRTFSKFDLIIICQTVFRFAEAQRANIFAHLTSSLQSGGVLVVNEIVRTDGPGETGWDKRYPKCIRRTELIDLLNSKGNVALYQRASDWKEPVDPMSVPGDQWLTDSFLVLHRNEK